MTKPIETASMFAPAALACALAALLACNGDDGGSTETTTTTATTAGTTTADTTADTTAGTTADTTDTESTGEAPLEPAALVGRWVSSACEAYPDGMGGTNYLTRDFTLTATTWSLIGVIFADAECATPFFQFEINGPYALGPLSGAIAGATEGDFGFTSHVWTARLPDAAELFNNAGCGAGSWEVDVAQDVSETGCIGVAKPIGDCPEEYDVVAVVGDDLFFGQRITDMCDLAGRPTALNTYAVVRQ